MLSTRISGGEAIYARAAGAARSASTSRSGSTYYFLTAGHCTNIAPNWYGNSGQTALLGTRAGSSFPGNDYGIVRYSNPAPRRRQRLPLQRQLPRHHRRRQRLRRASRRSARGSTTGLRSGSVTALNATVNYAEGKVRGLIRTNVCAQPGDSGGSLFSGSTALGLTSGGSGNCSIGGTTFFQPVMPVLSRYGVSVY